MIWIMRAAKSCRFSAAMALAVTLSACGGAGNTFDKGAASSAQTGATSTVPSDPLSFSASNYSAAQSAGSVTLTVTRAGTVSAAVSVDYTTVDGTAFAGTDYTATTGSVQWAENDSTPKTIVVPISNATPYTGDKTFQVVLSNPSVDAQIGSPDSATVTISGDATATVGSLQLSASSYAVAQSIGTMTVTVNRTGGSSGAVSVAYATSNGTAVAGTDYTAASGALQWADGDATSKTFTVAISNATPFSGSKSFSVALSNPLSGATLGSPSSANVTIDGDSSPPVGSLTFSTSSYTVAQNAGTVTVTVDRTDGSNGAVTVAYATSNGTAVSGKDFTAANGTLNWASGDATAKTFTIAISNATPFSGNKTLTVALSGPSGGATIANPGSASVTISGDAVAPVGSLRLSAASYTVSQGAGTVTVTVERTGGSNGAVSVAYATANGTAVAGTDYTATKGTLKWADGDASANTFAVTVSNATPFEGNKSFSVALSVPSGGATLSTPSSASVSITGDAGAAVGSLQLSAASYTVPQSAGALTVTVNRTGGSTGAVSVAYATANGTAVAGTDYTAANGTLNWAAGNATSKTFSVAISNATPFSGSKSFSVTLSSPSGGATLSTPSSASVTVTGGGSSGSGPGAPANLLMTGQTISSISLSWSAGSAGPYPVASYRVYRNGSLYATVTGTSYTDSAASNATVPAFTQNATIYSYAVTAVDTKGNESAQAYPTVYFYHNGVATEGQSDYSYGITENWQSTSGSPAVGTYDVSLMYPDGGGFQPYTNPPLAPNYDLELGSFKYLTLDVKVTDTHNYPFFISHISRLPPGDVYPRAWVNLFSYCTPVLEQWVTCKIPLSDLSIGFTNFTASISGTKLTVTSIQSGVGTDAGGFISGPGIPPNTYIVLPPGGVTYNDGQPPNANLLGTYTIAGPGVTSSLSVPSEAMSEQRTSLYKVDVGLHSVGGSTTIYLDNMGWTTN